MHQQSQPNEPQRSRGVSVRSLERYWFARDYRRVIWEATGEDPGLPADARHAAFTALEVLVSTGLRHLSFAKKLMRAILASNPPKFCRACGGDGGAGDDRDCAECNGTGNEPADARGDFCIWCKGKGIIPSFLGETLYVTPCPMCEEAPASELDHRRAELAIKVADAALAETSLRVPLVTMGWSADAAEGQMKYLRAKDMLRDSLAAYRASLADHFVELTEKVAGTGAKETP